MTPLVSVCVPTIDRPGYFRETLASLSAQVWKDFEVVVADNSADLKWQTQIDSVMGEFPGLRFELVRHPSRLDVAANFNSMIDAARGQFWTCLPDDDRFLPDFLDRSVKVLQQHPACGFTFADHWIVHDDGSVDVQLTDANSDRYGRTNLRPGVYSHDSLFGLALNQSLCLQTSVFRRSLINALRFPPGVMTIDHSFFLGLAAASAPFDGYYINERLMEYRLHSAQLSSTTRRVEFSRSVIGGFENVSRVPSRYRRQFNEKLSREYMALALAEAEQGGVASARRHARRSLALSPQLRNVLGALVVNLGPAVSPLRRAAKYFNRTLLTRRHP